MASAGEQDTRIPLQIKALLLALFFSSFGVVGMVTIIGKQVFDLTGRELDLGLLGLAEFVPIAALSPITGAIADRMDRRRVYGLALGLEGLVAMALFFYARSNPTSVVPIFGIVMVFGVARAFASPASRALPIDLAPPAILERVVALRSVAAQAGFIAGPITFGFLFVVDETPAVPRCYGSVPGGCTDSDIHWAGPGAKARHFRGPPGAS